MNLYFYLNFYCFFFLERVFVFFFLLFLLVWGLYVEEEFLWILVLFLLFIEFCIGILILEFIVWLELNLFVFDELEVWMLLWFLSKDLGLVLKFLKFLLEFLFRILDGLEGSMGLWRVFFVLLFLL